MSLVSIDFIKFVAISLLLYYIMPTKYQWIILFISSLFFYTSTGMQATIYLMITIITTYFAGLTLGIYNKKSEKNRNNRKKFVVIFITLILNFGILLFVKYWNFFENMINNILQAENMIRIEMIFPLGISFYIFQSTGYVIDVYRNKYAPEKNIFKYALFVSFFPQIVQGPIGMFDSLNKELFCGHVFSWDNLKDGLQLLMIGMLKKLIIADRAVIVVNTVIENYKEQNGLVILIAMILYCIQLYCDFSGGIDIIRAVAKMFGITLMENFKRPIFSTSLSEFWRRWHISLGTWMKEYLFFTLSISKPFARLGKKIRKYIPGRAGKIIPVSIITFIVYFVIGLWHGGNIKYIVFGAWNGAIITISLLLEPLFVKMKQKLRITGENNIFCMIKIIRTLIIVLIGRYITRAPEIVDGLNMLKLTFTKFNILNLFDSTLLGLGITTVDYVLIIVGTVVMLIAEAIDEYGIGTKKLVEKQKTIIQWIILMISILTLTVFGICRGNYIASEFIYKQF